MDVSAVDEERVLIDVQKSPGLIWAEKRNWGTIETLSWQWLYSNSETYRYAI